MPNAFGDVGRGEVKSHQDRILRHAHQAGPNKGISHSDLLRKQYGYLDAEQFKKLVTTLIEQRYLIRGQHVGLKSTYYVCGCDSCLASRAAVRKDVKDATQEEMVQGNGEGPKGPEGQESS